MKPLIYKSEDHKLARVIRPVCKLSYSNNGRFIHDDIDAILSTERLLKDKIFCLNIKNRDIRDNLSLNHKALVNKSNINLNRRTTNYEKRSNN